MPDFDRKYTYGNGRFSYTVTFHLGRVRVYCHELEIYVRSLEAVRFHLAALTVRDFRYID